MIDNTILYVDFTNRNGCRIERAKGIRINIVKLDIDENGNIDTCGIPNVGVKVIFPKGGCSYSCGQANVLKDSIEVSDMTNEKGNIFLYTQWEREFKVKIALSIKTNYRDFTVGELNPGNNVYAIGIICTRMHAGGILYPPSIGDRTYYCYWASKNVGASNINNVGDYYQFGMLTDAMMNPYEDSPEWYENDHLKQECDVANYIWKNVFNEEFVRWQMPTFEDFNDLINAGLAFEFLNGGALRI